MAYFSRTLDTSNFSFSENFPQLCQKTFSADTCAFFAKEFNGTEKEALKNMSNKSRLFLMIAFESKANTIHSK